MTEKSKIGKSATQQQDSYTDDEINELAEWLEDLTLKQAFFLKDSYEAMLNAQSQEHGNGFIH